MSIRYKIIDGHPNLSLPTGKIPRLHGEWRVRVDDKIQFVAPETTLAVIDARLGKRRIKALADNIENEPEWLRKWIQLRVGTQKKP